MYITVFQTITPYSETQFIIYILRQEVYSLQKHRTVTEHNKPGKYTPLKTTQRKSTGHEQPRPQ
jgi:hypothetical protein